MHNVFFSLNVQKEYHNIKSIKPIKLIPSVWWPFTLGVGFIVPLIHFSLREGTFPKKWTKSWFQIHRDYGLDPNFEVVKKKLWLSIFILFSRVHPVNKFQGFNFNLKETNPRAVLNMACMQHASNLFLICIW